MWACDRPKVTQRHGVGKVTVTDSGRVWVRSGIRQRQLTEKARKVVKYMNSHMRSEQKGNIIFS